MALTRSKLAIGDRADYALQAQQLCTGHAVLMAKQHLEGKTNLILVTYGDIPLLGGETLEKLVALHQQSGGPVTISPALLTKWRAGLAGWCASAPKKKL